MPKPKNLKLKKHDPGIGSQMWIDHKMSKMPYLTILKNCQLKLLTFLEGRYLDNNIQRWWRFELYECFLVLMPVTGSNLPRYHYDKLPSTQNTVSSLFKCRPHNQPPSSTSSVMHYGSALSPLLFVIVKERAEVWPTIGTVVVDHLVVTDNSEGGQQ